MLKRTFISTSLTAALICAPMTGCESLPGNEKQQGTVLGGAAGAAAGAAIAKNNRLIGALIGGALGAGGGYLIGTRVDKTRDGSDREKNREEAIKAAQRAEKEPAQASDVDKSRTADLNSDGFVTLDEVVAMQKANLADDEMITRLESTDQIFELTDYQQDYLRTRGVSDTVIRQMLTMNQDFARTASDELPGEERQDTISRDKSDARF